MKRGFSGGAGELVEVGGVEPGFLPLPMDGLPPFCFWISSRHFFTISFARRATSGLLCCLDRLTTTPILVERRRSSEGTTPVLSSPRILRMLAGESPAAVARCSALDFSTTSLASIFFGDMIRSARRVMQRPGCPVLLLIWNDKSEKALAGACYLSAT